MMKKVIFAYIFLAISILTLIYAISAWAAASITFTNFHVASDDYATTYVVDADLPFTTWDISGISGSETNNNYADLTAAETGTHGGMAVYKIQLNFEIYAEDSWTGEDDIFVGAYYRSAYDTTELAAASWILAGTNTVGEDGGVLGTYDQRFDNNFYFPVMSWEHKIVQWKVQGYDSNDAIINSAQSNRVCMGATATPTTVSTPTPTNTPTPTSTPTPTNTPIPPTSTPTPSKWISWRGASGTLYNHAIVPTQRRVSGGTYVECLYGGGALRVYPNPTPNEVGIHINIGGSLYVSRPDKTGAL